MVNSIILLSHLNYDKLCPMVTSNWGKIYVQTEEKLHQKARKQKWNTPKTKLDISKILTGYGPYSLLQSSISPSNQIQKDVIYWCKLKYWKLVQNFEGYCSSGPGLGQLYLILIRLNTIPYMSFFTAFSSNHSNPWCSINILIICYFKTWSSNFSIGKMAPFHKIGAIPFRQGFYFGRMFWSLSVVRANSDHHCSVSLFSG